MNTSHYVYKITNTNPTDKRKYYIGVRTSNYNPLDDINYWSSSKSLKSHINEQGTEYFSKEILSIWETREQAVAEEIKLHEELDVGRNPAFYNLAKQTSNGFDTTGTPLSDEHKEKISKFFKGRLDSDETRRKKSESLKGRKITWGDKISKAKIGKESWNKGKKFPEQTGEKNHFFGKTHSRETKDKISQESKKQWNNFSEEEKIKIGKQRSKTTIKNGSQKGPNNPMSKIYKVISPINELVICNGTLTIFCKENNLCYHSMLDIANGIKPKTKRSKHFGWNVEEITN